MADDCTRDERKERIVVECNAVGQMLQVSSHTSYTSLLLHPFFPSSSSLSSPPPQVTKICREEQLLCGMDGEEGQARMEKVRIHHYTITPLHHYTITPLHRYTVTPLHHYTILPLYHYTITPLHRCTIPPSHHNTITPLHHYTVTPLHHYTIYHYTIAPFPGLPPENLDLPSYEQK